MKQTTRDLWTDRIARWKKSGLDAETFAYSEGISVLTLKNRRALLERERRGVSVLKSAPSFVELVAPQLRELAPLEMTFSNGVRITVPAQMEHALLALFRSEA